MKQSTIIMLCGLPGCGKSTFSAVFRKSHPSYFILNKDMIRKMYFNSWWDPKREKEVWSAANLLFEDLLYKRKNMIIDETCCTKHIRAGYLNQAREYYNNNRDNHRYKTICVHYDLDYLICKDRNRGRDKQVDSWVIDKIDRVFEPPTKDEGFYRIIRVKSANQVQTVINKVLAVL